MKKTLIMFPAMLLTLLSSTAIALTWAEINFSPKEAFWSDELEDYLIGDSYELAVINPDTFGLKKSLRFSCSLDQFGDDPSAIRYDTSIVFEGTGANGLPVTAGSDEWFSDGDIYPVRIVTPSRDFTEDWDWIRYEDDYIGGNPAGFVTSGLVFGDMKNTPWIRIEVMGQTFSFETSGIQGYIQALERKCGEL